MAGDNLQVFPILAHHLGTLLGHKTVACAVETIPAYAILLIILVRYPIEVVLRLDREVKSRVKHRHLLYAGQHLSHCLHPHNIAGDMQRGKTRKCTGLFQHLGGDEHTLLEEFTAVGKPMAHSGHLLQRTYHTCLVADKRLHHHTKSVGMVVNGAFHRVLRTLASIGKNTLFQSYPFQQAFGQNRLGVHID